VTICHFPPGTSKWNKIEHRLFSQISIKRWSMAQTPLAEATGLSKNRIGATLRDTTPVLAALGYTVSPGPLTLTSTAQLEALVGRTPSPSPDQ
jgi:hypothetical protein